MYRRVSHALVVTGLMRCLGSLANGGAPPNPTASDADGNTAGGTNALINNM